MATAKQACDILDNVMRLPPRTAQWHASRLRMAGQLPATQGLPAQVTAADIAAVLIAVVTSSTMVDDYLGLRAGSGGPTFGKVLADFIDAPNDVFEIVIDTLAPGASATFRDADHGMQTIAFYPLEPKHRPAFERNVRLGPEIFIRLAAAIAAAPEVRAGRPRLRERFERT